MELKEQSNIQPNKALICSLGEDLLGGGKNKVQSFSLRPKRFLKGLLANRLVLIYRDDLTKGEAEETKETCLVPFST
jgi:hypothetical protein